MVLARNASQEIKTAGQTCYTRLHGARRLRNRVYVAGPQHVSKTARCLSSGTSLAIKYCTFHSVFFTACPCIGRLQLAYAWHFRSTGTQLRAVAALEKQPPSSSTSLPHRHCDFWGFPCETGGMGATASQHRLQ